MTTKKWLFALGLIAGSYLALNSITAAESYRRVHSREKPIKPPSTVSVIVPAWREPPELLEKSLSSLKEQTVVKYYPELFEFIFVGCEGVDLRIPFNYGFKILCTPRGKLRARHIGICSAAGDIIVAVDADSYYPPNWLNLMLRPFHDSDVIATTSTTWQGPLEMFVALPKLLIFNNKMSGRGSAFYKWAYFAVGGFDLNADERYLETRDINILIAEEEINFKRKLEKIGKVVLVDAPVVHLGVKPGRGLRS